MLLVLIIFSIVILLGFVLTPYIWCALGKIFKIENLTFKRAFLTFLILFLVGIVFQIIPLGLKLLKLNFFLIDLIISLTGLVVTISIIKTTFDTTVLKAIGLHLSTIALAVCLALSIRTYVIQAFRIPTGAMKNTILVGDFILVKKYQYKFEQPKNDDIIVFKYPKDPSKEYIKRVVGIGGETVEVREKKIYVNGQLQEEDFTVFADSRTLPVTLECQEDPLSGLRSMGCRDNMAPFRVPEGKLFVMGDNRDQSNDSRFWGMVDQKAVMGKAFIIYWSWDKYNESIRWSRISKSL